MKRILLTAAAGLMLVGWMYLCLPTARADDPELKGAFVYFHTGDDDKDSDTKLTITLEKGHDEYAIKRDITGRFEDHKNTATFALDVLGTVHKSAVQDAMLKIEIQPNGNDTWRFNPFLELVFSDGSHQKWEWPPQTLVENRNFVRLPLKD